MCIYSSTGWHNIKRNPAILQISFYGDKGCWRSRKSMANTVSSGLLLIFICHYFFFAPFIWYMLYLFCKLHVITYDRPSASLFNVIMYTVTVPRPTIPFPLKNPSTFHCFHLFYCHFLFYTWQYIFPDVDLFGKLYRIRVISYCI